MQRVQLQPVTRLAAAPAKPVTLSATTEVFPAAGLQRQNVVYPAQNSNDLLANTDAVRMQPLTEARVIRAPAEVVSYSPAQQMPQPAWPPMPAQLVRYEVLEPTPQPQPQQQQQQQQYTRVAPQQQMRPGVPLSYFTDQPGLHAGYEEPVEYAAEDEAFYHQGGVQYEEPFSQEAHYYQDMGDEDFYDHRAYDEQVDGQYGMMDEAYDDPHQQVQEQQQGEEPNQFMSLLESLEARVDLMAQMQHTRAAIQKRARAIEDMRTRQQGSGRVTNALEDAPMMDRFQPQIADTRVIVPAREVQAQKVSMTEQLMPYDREQALVNQNAAEHLARENAELWSQMRDQKDTISRLTEEVEGMRNTMSTMGQLSVGSSALDRSSVGFGGPPTGRAIVDDYTGPMSYPGSLGQADLAHVVGGRSDRAAGPLERLMAAEDGIDSSTRSATAMDVAGADMRTQLRMQMNGFQGSAPPDAEDEKRRLERELLEERVRQEATAQQWLEERNRLYSEIGQARAASVAADFRNKPALLDATAPVAPMRREPFSVMPFSRESCGVNLTLSEDGFTATRTRGCRQSVAIGSGPLQRQAHGWFFEVVVGETVTGWVGGLGIGVTHTAPSQLRRVPDKAWRLPSTYIVGYWGCVFLDGRERRTRWRSDTLQVGSRIGLLVTAGEGDLIIFVDDVPVVCAAGALRPKSRLGFDGVGAGGSEDMEPLYPVVDVFAATRVVKLSDRAVPPEPPWKVDAKTLSPPGSPVSVSMRSTQSLMNTTVT